MNKAVVAGALALGVAYKVHQNYRDTEASEDTEKRRAEDKARFEAYQKRLDAMCNKGQQHQDAE